MYYVKGHSSRSSKVSYRNTLPHNSAEEGQAILNGKLAIGVVCKTNVKFTES